MGDAGGDQHTRRVVGTAQLVRIGLLVTLVALAVGSIQFARYDWTGVRFQRASDVRDVTVSDDCTEQLRPFETTSGRIIAPAPLDEQQYLSMIQQFRGEQELQVECFYAPFTDRAALPWVASQLPFEDALSLALLNTAFLVIGIWAVLATLVVQGFSARVVLAVGLLVSANWLVFAFGTTLMIESAPFAMVAVCWWLMSLRRWWWVVPVVAVGMVVKETVILALPPMWVALWLGGGRTGTVLRRCLPAVAASVVAVAAYVVRVGIGPEPDDAWPTGVNLGLLSYNINPFGLVVLALGLAPLLVPAVLWFRRRVAAVGRIEALLDPAVVGVATGLGLLGWILITADLSPRFFWPAFPFAATLAARWCSEGRAAEWLSRRRLPSALVGPTTTSTTPD